MQACLRLSMDVNSRRLSVEGATLPPFLTWFRALNLELPWGHVDLLVERRGADVEVTVLRSEADIDVRVRR